jgi:hypothetical protein
MQRQKYYPSRIADQIVWLSNYADKAPDYLTAVGMGALGTPTVTDARWLIYVLGLWLTDVRSFNRAATEDIELALAGPGSGAPMVLTEFTVPGLPPNTTPVEAGALTRIFKVVAQFKEATGYTTAMGEDLGVIGAEDTADHPTPKYSLALGQGAGCQCVDISFTKYTHQGVYIESKRGTGNWEFVAIDTEKPYTDDRPLSNPAQPEVREYRLRFWDKGTPNGPWSEVQKITVAP